MTLRPCLFALLLLLVIAVFVPLAKAGSLTAFSLGEAEARLRSGQKLEGPLRDLGGITRLVAIVADTNGDPIILGLADPRWPRVTLDDVAVAIRAVRLHEQMPLVSIDRTLDTRSTRQQNVRYEGGVANTQFGKDFLDADVVLKKVALGLIDAKTEGIESVFARRWQDHLQRKGKGSSSVLSRFWFIAEDPPLLAPGEGVVVIRRLQITARTEVMGATTNTKTVTDLKEVHDEFGDLFTKEIAAQYLRLAEKYPSVARLKAMFDLVSLFSGSNDKNIAPTNKLGYWMRDYPVTFVETPDKFPVLEKKEKKALAEGNTLVLEMEGGISLRAITRRLKAGSVTALRDVTRQARPSVRELTWSVPVGEWRIPGDSDEPAPSNDQSISKAPASPPPDTPGFMSISRTANIETSKLTLTAGSHFGADIDKATLSNLRSQPILPQPIQSYKTAPQLPWQGGGVGGVMLCNTARIEDLDGATFGGAGIDPVTGSFNLLVNGKSVQVKDADLRKFVTVLWAVYFGKEDPGISIDPISATSDHQLVRIVGNIGNTQLANVLLDADYYMKKCAVGTERPPIRGFKNVDELTGKKGVKVLNAGRRFWFVPEKMAFRLCDNSLVFDSGQMTVKTEYLFLNNKKSKAEPADEEFARFWTEHYWEFAAVNPVFDELFEYARLTALAKYLKTSGVNLQWFLMANRHLVLEARTPGTVATLRSPSKTLRGVQWIGGVELGTNMSPQTPGRYWIDETATQAIKQALSDAASSGNNSKPTKPAPASGNHTSFVDKSFVAQLPDSTYTVLPAKGLTSGMGKGGITYHTDMALRNAGEPGVELVRYNKAGPMQGLLGKHWDLYRPYTLRPAAGSKMVKVAKVPVLTNNDELVTLDLQVYEKLQIVDLLANASEVLTLDKRSFDTIAWVADDPAKSKFVGLTCLQDGSYLLTETGGCRFRFDPVGRLTDILFSNDHRVHYDYDGNRIVAVLDSFGGKVTLDYDDKGRVKNASSNGASAQYKYMDDELAAVKYSDGRRLVLIYNSDGTVGEVVSKMPRQANNTINHIPTHARSETFDVFGMAAKPAEVSP